MSRCPFIEKKKLMIIWKKIMEACQIIRELWTKD